jgi:hypothetical protein
MFTSGLNAHVLSEDAGVYEPDVLNLNHCLSSFSKDGAHWQQTESLLHLLAYEELA